MRNNLYTSFIILLVITLLSTGISYFATAGLFTLMIVVLSIIKFGMVGFSFMELRYAHSFWKALFVLYSLLIGFIFTLLLSC